MTTATQMLEYYMTAEIAALEGRDFQFNGRRVTMQDLPSIRKGRKEWEARVTAEQVNKAGGTSGYALTRFI